MWEVGKRYKIVLLDGSLYTGDIISIEDPFIWFQDKKGAKVHVNKNSIMRTTELDENGVGGFDG